MEEKVYEITIKGHLSQGIANDIVQKIELKRSGISLLRTPMVDQAALFGILTKIRDLGITLISLKINEEGVERNEM
ncbi:MAG: hypothetical protein OCD02_03490 [Spirochaetaceae bacterium]